MRTRFFLVSTILLYALLRMDTRLEAKERYTLHSRGIPGGEQQYVWLQDGRNHRVLWKRRLTYYMMTHWSKDHKALAIECQVPSPKHTLTGVFLWREGHRLRFLGPPGGDEFTMGCVWSPDNRRLLVRTGGSDAMDADYGALFCVWLGNWPRYKIFRVGAARKMAWLSRKTAIFWDVEVISPKFNPQLGDLKKPELWHAP